MHFRKPCVIALVLAYTLPLHSALANSSGWFVSADVAHVDPNSSLFTSGTGFDVLGGFRWSVAEHFAVGLEGGYDQWPRFTWPETARLDNRGAMLGANGRFYVGDTWFVGARIGKLFARTKGDYGLTGPLTGPTKSLTRDYAGFELGHDFLKHVSVAFRYTHVPDIRRHVELPNSTIVVPEVYLGASEHSLSVEYRF